MNLSRLSWILFIASTIFLIIFGGQAIWFSYQGDKLDAIWKLGWAILMYLSVMVNWQTIKNETI